MAESGWTIAFVLANQEITLTAGEPMTCVRFDAWQSMQLPLTDYAIEFLARLESNDVARERETRATKERRKEADGKTKGSRSHISLVGWEKNWRKEEGQARRDF